MNKVENIIGFVLLLLIFIFGGSFFSEQMLFFRFIIGCGFGYALTRSCMGFAGSVNRPYRTGSVKLIKVLVLMFLASTIVTTALAFNDPSALNLSVSPINLGLALGGLLFGFGMSFSSCCATGTLAELVSGPRAFITFVFFGLGVFLGFPFKGASWVKQSFFTSKVGAQTSGGVYFPDWFQWDGLNGYMGATILTALLVWVTILIANKYQEKRRAEGTLCAVASELEQEKFLGETEAPAKFFSKENYERLFVRPWRMEVGAAVIAAIFILLTSVTKSGWGASTIYGLWFGKLLTALGASADSLASFTGMKAQAFTNIFSHPVSVQNIGIIVGALLCLLLAGALKSAFMYELKIKALDILIFAIGGFTMGFGTRLSNGCNVGALYTPIANFSLSGWLFFIFLILGGIIGNKVLMSTKKSCGN